MRLWLGSVVVFVGFAGLVVWGGPIDPPTGPVSSTMKTLDEIEPRVDIATLAGDGEALHVIDAPGSYYLTGSIVGVSGKSGIRVTSDDVTIDLNGFTLQGVAGSLDGIEVGDGIVFVNNLHVRNGVVRGWGRRGIDGDFANNALVEGIRALGNGETGIRVGAGVSPPMGPVVRNCVSQGNALHGFQVENGVIEGCVAADNLARGINALGSVVQHCVATNNDTDGIGGSGVVSSSVAVANGIDGIHFSGTVSDCRVSNNGNDGIEVEPGSVVRDCRVSFSGQVGVRLGEGSLISGSSVHENQQEGILASDSCVVRDNLCDRNGAAGIRVLGFGNRIEGNSVSGSLRGIELDIGGNLVVRNSATGNGVGFDDPGGNTIGPIVSGGGVIVSEHPWANFEF